MVINSAAQRLLLIQPLQSCMKNSAKMDVYKSQSIFIFIFDIMVMVIIRLEARAGFGALAYSLRNVKSPA